MNCDPNALMAAAACFKCIPRGELRAVWIALVQQWAERSVIPPTPGELLVEEWVERVVTNGGTVPSDNTQAALVTFADDLIDSGLDLKMKALNCMVPDSLAACCTPLIVGTGSSYWTPSAWFVANPGQLNSSGLKGGAAGNQARLDTGVIPSTSFGFTAAGATVYVTDPGGVFLTSDLGIWSNIGQFFHLVTCYGNTFDMYFDCWDVGASGRIFVDRPSGFTGYVSGNRLATNDSKLYIANSTTPHGAVGSNVNANVPKKPTTQIPLFCIFDSWSGGLPGNYTNYTDRRIAFCALHDGLTQTESATFYGLIQALRTTLGGAV